MAIVAPISATDIQRFDANSIKATEAVVTKDDSISIKPADSRYADFTVLSPCGVSKLTHSDLERRCHVLPCAAV